MNRSAALCLFLCLLLASCYEKQIDEPFYELEYDVNGEHVFYKDMGMPHPGLFGSVYESSAEGSLFRFKEVDDSTRTALFSVDIHGHKKVSPHTIEFELTSETPFFFERRKYFFQQDSVEIYKSPACVDYDYFLSEGTFSFVRVRDGGYGQYLLSFDFDCVKRDGSDTLRFRYGQFLVCNRLVKSQGNSRMLKMILHEL